MQTVILDAMGKDAPIAAAIVRALKSRGAKISRFQLRELNILPCRSCGSCACLTPGACVFSDEMPTIMRAIAPSTLLVLLTPVNFGGYAAALKKAVDKFLLMGLPLYIVQDGHLLHPMRYGTKSLLGIGVLDKNRPSEAESFKDLVAQNALNMQFPYRAIIFQPTDGLAKIEPVIEKTLGEVC
jgi:multimeric flavodoxin WrbA